MFGVEWIGPGRPGQGFTSQIEMVAANQLTVEITSPSRTRTNRKTEARQNAVMNHDSLWPVRSAQAIIWSVA